MVSPVSLRAPVWRLYSSVRSRRFAPAVLALAMALVVLSSCATNGSTATNSGTPSATSAAPTKAPAATSTPLSSVPQVTMAFCQGLVSLADANTIMQPSAPATAIVPDNARPGGSCSYVNGQTHLVLTIFFQPFPQGTSLNSLAQQAVQQAEAKNGIPGGANVTLTPVSGIGDQAVFGSLSGTYGGVAVFYAALDATLGSVWISCFNFGEGSPTTPQQPALTKVCSQVVSRL